jgi:uncharacterized membrane protein
MDNKKPSTIEEVKSKRKPLVNPSTVVVDNLSKSEKVALWVTNKVSTTKFFLLIFFWSAIWLSWNIFAPTPLQFDPAPGFVFWLFISNMIQILLMPLILIGQNISSKHSDARVEHDLNINIKAEQEIEVVLEHLEFQNTLILEILRKTQKND